MPDGLCSHRECSALTTNYFNMKVGDEPYLLPVCKKHAEEIEEQTFKKHV